MRGRNGCVGERNHGVTEKKRKKGSNELTGKRARGQAGEEENLHQPGGRIRLGDGEKRGMLRRLGAARDRSERLINDP